jgi:hypothetical protein
MSIYRHREPMATKRPRTTISFDFDEYQELKNWADSEFRSIPQLVLVLVKKALIERKERNSTEDPPTEAVAPSATKAKRGNKKETTAP